MKVPAGEEEKTKVFAGDTIMFMVEDISIVKVIRKFEDFKAASGNKINVGKTSSMNMYISSTEDRTPPHTHTHI